MQRGSKKMITVIDKLGTDATIVNAARVSFGKKITGLGEGDIKLLNYLAKNSHFSPFRSAVVQFHIKAPEFVARQWWKHIVGTDYVFKDTQWNELSGRYVEYDLEPYIPANLRKQATNKKQGSSDQFVDNQEELLQYYEYLTKECFAFYKIMCDRGVAKEQARTILPLNFYTEWYWTASLQAIHHFCNLRKNKDSAQSEIVEYAVEMDKIMLGLFPNAWAALNNNA